MLSSSSRGGKMYSLDFLFPKTTTLFHSKPLAARFISMSLKAFVDHAFQPSHCRNGDLAISNGHVHLVIDARM